MSLEIFVIIGLILAIAVIFFRKNSGNSKTKTDEMLLEWLKSMQSSLETTNKTINEALSKSSNQMVQTLQENSKQLNERLDKAASVIKDVGLEVGKMSEIGRNMREL